MKKRVLRISALVLALAMLLASAVCAYADDTFSSRTSLWGGGGVTSTKVEWFDDVSDHWARDSIAYAVENGMMNGMYEHEFMPNYPMTRAMLVTVLWRLEGSRQAAKHAPFNDVEQGSWYETAVSWACEVGVVEGMGDGSFQPATAISRQDFTVMLYRYAKLIGRDQVSWRPAIVFTDNADIAEYAFDSVNWCTRNGIVKGRPNGEFSPRDTTTRAEGCTMLHAFLTQTD